MTNAVWNSKYVDENDRMASLSADLTFIANVKDIDAVIGVVVSGACIHAGPGFESRRFTFTEALRQAGFLNESDEVVFNSGLSLSRFPIFALFSSFWVPSLILSP